MFEVVPNSSHGTVLESVRALCSSPHSVSRQARVGREKNVENRKLFAEKSPPSCHRQDFKRAPRYKIVRDANAVLVTRGHNFGFTGACPKAAGTVGANVQARSAHSEQIAWDTAPFGFARLGRRPRTSRLPGGAAVAPLAVGPCALACAASLQGALLQQPDAGMGKARVQSTA